MTMPKQVTNTRDEGHRANYYKTMKDKAISIAPSFSRTQGN